MENKLHHYFENPKRGIDAWGNCGTIVGYSDPIVLTCPIGKITEIGGGWLFKRDKDGAEHGVHKESVTICKECPKKCIK